MPATSTAAHLDALHHLAAALEALNAELGLDDRHPRKEPR